jgi:NAD(P)-dependent dehydrogenase (short-subunit alcohol dehydrogenase family)
MMCFATEGACGRNDMAVNKLQAEHPKIEVVQCDITVRPDVLALVETVRDRYGKIDVLVNNAGIIERVNFLEESVSDERIAYEIAVNLRGPILLTRRLLPLLRSGRNPMSSWSRQDTRCCRHGRSDLLRDSGRSPRLHDGATAPVA